MVTSMGDMPAGSDRNPADAEVLAAADAHAERAAALVRLAVAAFITLLLGAMVATGSNWNSWITLVCASNLVLAGAGVYISRAGVLRSGLPWLSSTVDAFFLLCVGIFGPWFEILPAGMRSALVSPWGIFLALAIATVRAHPGTIVFQTVLLGVGFSVLVWWPGDAVSNAIVAVEQMLPLFSDSSNLTRLAVIGLTGAVMAFGAYRSRRSLKLAIRSARERAALERFLPAEVNQRIFSSDVESLKAGSRHEVSLLFADLRNFTTLSETLEPDRVAQLLNSFRARAERVIAAHGGVIDKFIGDGLLAVFGLSEPREADAAQALAAAEALLDEVAAWSQKRVRHGRGPVEIGIGIHTGTVFVGALGGDRMEFTVIGDAVNVAQRLEAITRQVASSLVASEAVLLAAHLDIVQLGSWKKLPGLQLRGRSGVLDAYGRRAALRPGFGHGEAGTPDWK